MAEAKETPEERNARVVAEAQANAAKRIAEQQAREFAERQARDDEPILFYSIFPTLSLGIQSEKKELVPLADGGGFREIATRKNRRVEFRDHKAVVRRGDIPAIRKFHGYGDKFVEARDLKDGDKAAASLEVWHAKNDVRGYQFAEALKGRAKRVDPRPMYDDYQLRRDVSGLVAKGVFA